MYRLRPDRSNVMNDLPEGRAICADYVRTKLAFSPHANEPRRTCFVRSGESTSRPYVLTASIHHGGGFFGTLGLLEGEAF